AAVIAAAILAGSALISDWLLRTLSIGLPAFRLSGGLFLFSIASEMVFGVRIERQSRQAEEAIEEHVRNVAAFPLAIPLMAGPGAVTTPPLPGWAGGGGPAPPPPPLCVLAAVRVIRCASPFCSLSSPSWPRSAPRSFYSARISEGC